MNEPTQAEADRIEWLQLIAIVRSAIDTIEAKEKDLKSTKNANMARGMIAAIKQGANQWI
jgi:hypothetical protein